MDMMIRRAVKEDCERMLELVQELAEFEKAPDEVTVSPEHFIESGFGEKPVWWAFVAEVVSGGEKQIIGMALYYIRYSTWKGQRLFLEDLVITQEWRGKGVGKQLFDKIIEEAKEKKFKGMMWQVLDWNEPAISFYKKYGASFDGEWVNCALSEEQVNIIREYH